MDYFKKNSLFISYLFLANPYYFLFHEISEIRNLPFPPVNRCMSSQLSQKGHLTSVHRKKSGYGYINYHYCKACTHEIRWNKKSYFFFCFLFLWNYENSYYFLFHEIEIVHPYSAANGESFASWDRSVSKIRSFVQVSVRYLPPKHLTLAQRQLIFFSVQNGGKLFWIQEMTHDDDLLLLSTFTSSRLYVLSTRVPALVELSYQVFWHTLGQRTSSRESFGKWKSSLFLCVLRVWSRN